MKLKNNLVNIVTEPAIAVATPVTINPVIAFCLSWGFPFEFPNFIKLIIKIPINVNDTIPVPTFINKLYSSRILLIPETSSCDFLKAFSAPLLSNLMPEFVIF